MLGIDEAGRGPVLGPLVVGAFLVPAGRSDALSAIGVRDSKELRPGQRAQVFDALAGLGELHHEVLGPPEIDRAVRRGRLNDLEARAFARLVRKTRPEVAYLDACDPVAARFGRTVASYANVPTRIVARHKADRDNPVVGAASIVAKVLRDRAIDRLRQELGEDPGSGYPADPTTRAFLAERLRRGERPGYVRHSWQTTHDLLPRRTPARLEAFR